MKKWSLMVLLGLLFALCSCQTAEKQPAEIVDISEENEVRVLFINVGKADATLLQLGKKNYLIDTGDALCAPKLLGALRVQGVDSLHGVFLTHTHSDHIGGLPALAEHVKIEKIYSAEISETKADASNKIVDLVQSLALPHTKLMLGDQVELQPAIALDVIAPRVYNEEDDNDNSLVLKLQVNDAILLFAGDMQFAQEQTLLDATVPLAADVLKVGNHGNPDATSADFAKAVSPKIAVISTDTNVDEDSANVNVQANLQPAQIHVTQQYPLGVMLTVAKDGALSVSNPELPKSTAQLEIVAVDKVAQTVRIVNRGDAADLTDFCLLSTKGKELFVFPKNTTIKAGQTITIACEGGEGDFIWAGEDKVWNTKKDDFAILYDAFGNLLSKK